MKRRRFKPRAQNGGLRKGIIFGIIFCILLPVGAIYIGLKITENVIVPVFDSSQILSESSDQLDLPKEEISDGEAENQNGSSLTEAIEIKPISIYTIQIASITDRSNIDNLIGELNDKELPHLIYSVDNKFKIFTYGSTRRSFIETKLEKVREHYPDAFISEMYLPKKTVRYNEDDKGVEEIIEAINNIIELIDKQSEEWYNYGGTSAYTDLLNKHEELIENLSGKIAEKNFSKEYFNKNAMEKALIYQLNNINTSLELIESSKEEHRIHSLYLDSLFRVVELTK